MNLELDASLLDSQSSDRKKLSYFQVVWTAFLLTSAGPFGFEYTVSGVGIGDSLLLITLFALVYCLPIALISSELSGLMPSRHGQIAWGYRAFSTLHSDFGDFIGFLNASNIVIFWTLNTAALPIILVQYLTTLTGPLSGIATYSIKLLVIVSGLILNCFNFSIIASITSVLCVAIIIPFFVAFFWQLPYINPATQWTESSSECSANWALAVTTCLWEFSGFESLANMMNEVDFKPRRLISAYSIAIIIDAVLLSVPIITCATFDATCAAWYDGYFAASFSNIAVGMEYAVAIGSVLMNWCMYLAAIGVISRMIWAMAQPYFEVTRDGQMITPGEMYSDEHNARIAMNILPYRFFGEIWHETGSAVYSVVLVSVLIAVVNIYLDFDQLVEFNIFTYFVPFIIELFAYLALKHMEPNAPRTFEIPFGKVGAWVTVSVVFVAMVICFCIMVVANPMLFGIAVALNVGLTAYYFISKTFCHRMYQSDLVNNDKFENISDGDETVYTTETSVDDYDELQPLIL
eukprot:682294_1